MVEREEAAARIAQEDILAKTEANIVLRDFIQVGKSMRESLEPLFESEYEMTILILCFLPAIVSNNFMGRMSSVRHIQMHVPGKC